MIVLIDNYDSFSYNLYQLIGELNPNIRVVRNDVMSVDELAALQPEAIIISPGPGRPCDAGICEDVVQRLSGTIPLLGVCLGHQAICEAFGGTVGYAKQLMHGKSSMAAIDTQSPLFAGMSSPLKVARYHSLAVETETLPDCLQVIAYTDDGEIMAVQHREHPTYGVQFHPESILTPQGRDILKRFLDIASTMKPTTASGV